MRVIVALAGLCALGCAAAAPPVASPAQVAGGAEVATPEMLDGDRQIVFDEHGSLVALSTEVEQLASAAECAGACDAGERLCALGDRICALAARNAGDTEIEARCADGRARCETARARLAQACGCSAQIE